MAVRIRPVFALEHLSPLYTCGCYRTSHSAVRVPRGDRGNFLKLPAVSCELSVSTKEAMGLLRLCCWCCYDDSKKAVLDSSHSTELLNTCPTIGPDMQYYTVRRISRPHFKKWAVFPIKLLDEHHFGPHVSGEGHVAHFITSKFGFVYVHHDIGRKRCSGIIIVLHELLLFFEKLRGSPACSSHPFLVKRGFQTTQYGTDEVGSQHLTALIQFSLQTNAISGMWRVEPLVRVEYPMRHPDGLKLTFVCSFGRVPSQEDVDGSSLDLTAVFISEEGTKEHEYDITEKLTDCIQTKQFEKCTSESHSHQGKKKGRWRKALHTLKPKSSKIDLKTIVPPSRDLATTTSIVIPPITLSSPSLPAASFYLILRGGPAAYFNAESSTVSDPVSCLKQVRRLSWEPTSIIWMPVYDMADSNPPFKLFNDVVSSAILLFSDSVRDIVCSILLFSDSVCDIVCSILLSMTQFVTEFDINHSLEQETSKASSATLLARSVGLDTSLYTTVMPLPYYASMERMDIKRPSQYLQELSYGQINFNATYSEHKKKYVGETPKCPIVVSRLIPMT
uniref:(California timema) hypothetical protein n=1 Tax=Timema californicum TaxID=61474 RepID=A0A7R9J7U1_TIMCA|nr:unnamed protein product [Timema californicum]